MRTARETSDQVRLLRLSVGAEQFALEMDAVLGVQGSDLLVPSGPDPDGFAGRLPSQLGDLPVYHLGTQLELTRPEVVRGQIVTVRVNDRVWAILADQVSRVLTVPSMRITRLPRLLARTAVPFKGVVRLDESDSCLLLAPDRLDPELPSITDEPSRTPRPRVDPSHDLSGTAATRRGQVLAFSVTEPSDGLEEGPSIALSVTQVLEILAPRPVLRVPKAPPTIIGLISWRDRQVPVVDLGRRLGLPAFRSRGPSLLVVARADRDQRVAFPIHPGIRTIRLPVESAPCPEPMPLAPGLTRGVFTLPYATVIVPDLPGIVAGG